jgi:photosystem II stability/assembly factor-like uncharacterized protein
MDVSRADPGVIYGLYGSIQVSRDGGETWVVATAPPADTFDLAASAVDADLVYAATREGLMVSRDAAISWEPTGPAGQPASMVQVAPDGSVYAFVIGTGLIRAPGTALAWQPISNEFGSRILLHLAIDPSDSKRIFAVTQDGGIFASTDGGRTWGAFPS